MAGLARFDPCTALAARIAVAAVAILAVLVGRAHADPVDKNACFDAYEAAQRFKLASRYRGARQQAIVCSNEACPAELRRDCVRWLTDLDGHTPSIVVAARAGAVEVGQVHVLMDGELIAQQLDGSALPVDPGTHRFRFEAGAQAPIEMTIVVQDGEKNRRIDVQFAASIPTSSGRSIAAWTLTGVGAAALISFAGFAIAGRSKKSDLEDCKGHCAQQDVDVVTRDYLIADISLGAAAVSAGLATWLFLSMPSAAASRAGYAPPWFALAPIPQGAAASVSWHF